MKGIIEWFARNPIAGNSLMAMLLILGTAAWFDLRKEIFPEISVDVITIRVPYPSASPEEVETGICIPVEEAVQDLDGIDRLSSTAAEGYGVVAVEVQTGTDAQQLMNDIRSRVDAIDNFPEQAESPVIEEVLLKTQVLSLALSADLDEASLRQLGEQIRDDLIAYDPPPPAGPFAHLLHRANPQAAPVGVDYSKNLLDWIVVGLQGKPRITQATLFGARDYEISLEVSEAKLAEHGLTFQEVADAVRATSLDLPGGSVRAEGGEVLLRVRNKRYDAAGFAELVLRGREGGEVVRVGDVATVREGFEEGRIVTRFDQRGALILDIYRVGDQDTLRVAELAKHYVAHQAPGRLPPEARLEVWNDVSLYLEGRLHLLATDGFWGLVLVLVSLALFMRLRLALVVALSIPVTFAGALMVMPLTGISVNMISAFAFILVLGIVVDDATIIGETVYSRIQKGQDSLKAAIDGTHEVGTMTIFGVLVMMLAFVPMLMVSGVSGKIWPNIPWVVIPTLFFSLLHSKLVLPGHLAKLHPRPRGEGVKSGWFTKLQRACAGALDWVNLRLYQPLLGLCLSWRWATLAAFVGIFLVMMAVVASGRVPFTFLPAVEADVLAVQLEMAAGTAPTDTDAVVRRLEETAWRLNERFRDRQGRPIVRHVLAASGTQVLQAGFSTGPSRAEHLGEVGVELSPAAERDVTAKQLIGAWREAMGPVPGLVEMTFIEATGPSGNAFDLEISGDSMEMLAEVSAEIRAELAKYTGVTDITDSNRRGKREARIELRPEARDTGLTEAMVAAQVRQAFYGEEAQRLQRGRDEVKVMVRYPEQERRSLDSLENFFIRLPAGGEVPFSEVATYRYERGYAAIQRAGRAKAITISADVDRTVPGAVNPALMSGEIEHRLLPRLKERYPGLRWEFRGEQKDQNDSVRDIGIGFLMALVGIYILLAIPLRSWVQPLIVMTAIPFGIVGAIIGHLVFGLEFSIMSMCGVVALAGVVVNDSLVLVDFVNRHRAGGKPPAQAARESGGMRFRAVFLVSLTTFVGLIPMVSETDIQAKFLVPMAVALAFGILFATVITLLLVPAIYLIIEDLKKLVFTAAAREKMEQRFREARADEAMSDDDEEKNPNLLIS